jgi:hypothetical protein
MCDKTVYMGSLAGQTDCPKVCLRGSGILADVCSRWTREHWGMSAVFLCWTLMSSSTCCQCLSFVSCFWTRAFFCCYSFLSSKSFSLITYSGFWIDNCNLFLWEKSLCLSWQCPEASGHTDPHQFEFLPDQCHWHSPDAREAKQASNDDSNWSTKVLLELPGVLEEAKPGRVVPMEVVGSRVAAQRTFHPAELPYL